MLNWIADYLVRRAKRTPYFYLAGYMERDWLVPQVDGGSLISVGCGPVTWRRPIAKVLQKLGVAVRVHKILRSDDDRALHDHPWPYVTVILKGGYFEVTNKDGVEVSTWYGPGSILFRKATDAHRLVLNDGDPATTLFITGRLQQVWGFFPNGPAQKVLWNRYLNEKRKGNVP